MYSRYCQSLSNCIYWVEALQPVQGSFMIDVSQLAIKKGFSVGIPCSFWRVLQLRKDRPVFETLAKVGILKPTSKMIHASSWGEPEQAMQNLRFAMANIPFVCHDKNLRTWHGMSAVSKTSLDIGDHTCWQTADRLWAACSCLSWSTVAMRVLTWVVFTPGFFHAVAALWQ